MNRFMISAPYGYQKPTYHKTIEEVVNQLKSKACDTSLNTYYITCLIDDIEITADELLQVWEEGERPEDLQFF
jgi:hypothetical protein